MAFKAYHKNLSTLHVGCEEPRSYFVPFADEASALAGGRETSARFLNLCGEWGFRWHGSFEDIGSSFPDETISGKIAVPLCWQVLVGRGYDVPLYSNLEYPFPLDPPHVPLDNPCGHYRRTFTLPEGFGERVYINFEGVSSCFYLFVNGSFAAYSQVSRCTSEIEITKYLNGGENTLDVLVVKWCDGSYLEDQDCFRLSGIFREVYLLGREREHISDFYVRSEVSERLDSAQIKIETLGVGECVFTLFDPSGKKLYSGTENIISLNSPTLWNAEEPQLYTLLIKCGSEYIAQKIGLKRLEIKGDIVYLNGKKIKLWGINRHDSSPVGGYTATVGEMLRDLYLLKRANCNCVRTSHYPNDPRFLELCDELGIMLVNEADIETHGMGFEYRDTWDWTRWSMLSTVDEWEEAYVDRAKRLFERDKNHACVVMWSLGNESGCGKNHRAMRRYIKSRDPGAIVHYENAHLEFTAVPEGENFADISDVESRMYAELEYTENYLKNSPKKPFYFCEYVCDNSTGNIFAHCRLADKYDNLFGLCIWEMNDHALAVEKNGKTCYRYGGDFGDYPNNGDCCVDGLVFANRTPRPGYYDMKRAYQPFTVSYSNGRVTVFNKRFFTSLADLKAVWKIEADGKTVFSGETGALNIEPRTSAEFEIDFNPAKLAGECYLTLSFVQLTDTAWANAGYETGFEQFKIHAQQRLSKKSIGAVEAHESERMVEVTANNTRFVFDKTYGRLTEITDGGKNILAAPVAVQTWLAHPRNLRGAAEERRSAGIDRAVQQTYSCEVKTNGEAVELTFKVSLGGPRVVPIMRGEIKYVVSGDGSVKISFAGAKNPLAPVLPRFGFAVTLVPGYEKLRFFGMGPVEAYADRLPASRMALWSMAVSDNFVNYLPPKENSAHALTLFGAVLNEQGRGLMVSSDRADGFYFNASHFTPQLLEAAAHDDELVPLAQTVINADLHIEPFGGHGYYDSVEPQRVIDESNIKFAVTLRTVDENDNLFELI